MLRDGAIIFGDLTGKLDVPYVHCAKCARSGRNQVKRLIEERGRDGKIIDWLIRSPPTARRRLPTT